eukprot:NODE_283_length_10814_cov_0.705460.p8 type:complete len:173 gc:universal NODE_283_length_10814_cov_0.705460:7115-6597(-)
MAFAIPLFVYFIPVGDSLHISTFILVIICTIASSFFSNSQFISISAFISQVADPRIGGTYTTLLNTFSNLGGTWPKFFILELVDLLSDKQCFDQSGLSTGHCVKPEDALNCSKSGGKCEIITDGYYTVAAASVAIGIVLYFLNIQQHITYIQKIPKSDWKISAEKVESKKRK